MTLRCFSQQDPLHLLYQKLAAINGVTSLNHPLFWRFLLNILPKHVFSLQSLLSAEIWLRTQCSCQLGIALGLSNSPPIAFLLPGAEEILNYPKYRQLKRLSLISMRVLNAGYDLWDKGSTAALCNHPQTLFKCFISWFGSTNEEAEVGVCAHWKSPTDSSLHASEPKIISNSEINAFLTVKMRHKAIFSQPRKVFLIYEVVLCDPQDVLILADLDLKQKILGLKFSQSFPTYHKYRCLKTWLSS